MIELLRHESIIRLGCFFTVLLAMMLWEWRRPRRTLSLPRTRRWPANLGIIVVDSIPFSALDAHQTPIHVKLVHRNIWTTLRHHHD